MEDIQFDDGLSEAWPKEFSELKELEKLLRCNICKDFMKTALITGCSHLFCSYCIRQSIQYRNQCPACFAELYDNQLRPERTLDEVVRIFTSVKRKLLKRLQISYAACPGDEREAKLPAMPLVTTQQQESNVMQSTCNTMACNLTEDQAKATTSVLLFNSPRKSNPECPAVVKHRTVPDMFSPRKLPSSQASKPGSSHVTKRESGVKSETPGVAGSSVPCPVCSVDIPDKHINLHLDECLARANGAPPKSQPMNKPSRKPLAKLVLSLMKEKELKHYCKEYGLSTLGERKSLISRIQRYTTLYNSECDSLNPRSRLDIIRQIEREEKSITANTAAKPLFPQITRKTDPKIIEEANTKYLQDNKTAFEKLIENMKSRDGSNIVRCPRPSVNRILSDEEEDVKPEPRDCTASTSTTAGGTPKSRYSSKGDADSQNTTPTSHKEKRAPPLSPDIQVAPSPSQNRSSSPLPLNLQSPSLLDYMSPIQGSSRNALTSSTPMIPNSSNRKSNVQTKLIKSTRNTNILSTQSDSKPSPSTNSSKVTASLHNSVSKTNVSQSVDEFDSFFSDHSPTSSPSSRKQSSVQYKPPTSPLITNKGSGAESPDLFLADGLEEDELAPSAGTEQCTSPDLLGNLNPSCSLSQKSQVTTGGHFLFSDSDSDIEDNNKTMLTGAQGNKSTVNGCLDNEEKTRASDELSQSCQEKSMSESDRTQSSRKKTIPGRVSDDLINGGDSEDDEDFLQLVQNRRAKRKPKQASFSPRATRSKRLKP